MEPQRKPMHSNWKGLPFEGLPSAFGKFFLETEMTSRRGRKSFYKNLVLTTHGHEKESFYENLLDLHHQDHILKQAREYYIQAMRTHPTSLSLFFDSKWKESISRRPYEAVENLTYFLKLSKKLISQREQFLGRFKKLVKEIDEESLSEILNIVELDANSVTQKVDELIRVSIDRGNVGKARKILKFAVSLFPNHEDYKNLQKVIAPPKIIGTKESEPRGIGNTIAFLKKSGRDFLNKWVAVSDGRLLGISESYAELFERHKGQNVIITRVV